MKKISSMLALGMALALTFGMTVSAAESTTTANPDFKPTTEQEKEAEAIIAELPAVSESTAKDANGKTVALEVKPIQAETVAELRETTVADKALSDLKSNKTELTNTVAKAMEAAVKFTTPEGKGVDPDSVEIVKDPVAAATIEIPAGTVIPATGLKVEISLPTFKPAADKIYVVMHLGKNGWEIIAPDEISDGKVVATFKDLSPVTVNELEYKLVVVPVGEDVDNPNDDSDDDSDQKQAAPTTANPATSPKTAETLPAAGVMALICLAGAAVCAGKIRYNK